MTTGQRIKSLRIALGMTQEELAAKCGYKSKTTINKIETSINGISMDKVQKIALVLECDPSYLMGWTNSDSEKLNKDKAYRDIDLLTKYSMLSYDNKQIISATINKMLEIQDNK